MKKSKRSLKKINDQKEKSAGGKRNHLLFMILLVLSSAAAYYNSIKTPFVFDDIPRIVKNRDIRDIGRLHETLIYPYGKEKYIERNDPSRPLLYFTYALNYAAGKLDPRGYHIFNLLLHIANVLLLFFCSSRLLLILYGKEYEAAAFAASLLFSVHPLLVSSVSYIYSRSVLLASSFYLLSFLMFMKAAAGDRKAMFYSLLFLTAGLFSRQDAITVVALMFISDYVLLSRFSFRKVLERKYIYMLYFTVIAAYIAYRYFYFGAIGDIEARTPFVRWQYLAMHPYMLMRYLQMIFVPYGLSMDHIIEPVNTFWNIRVLAPLAALFLLLSAALYLSRRKEYFKLLIFSAAWFYIILAPTSSVFPTTKIINENRVYLAAFMPILCLVLAVFAIYRLQPGKSSALWKSPVLLLLALSAVLLANMTVKRNILFRDPVLLWKNVVHNYPAKAYGAHLALGELYYSRGFADMAIKEYKEALEIRPSYAKARYNLGAVYNELGRNKKALEEFNEVIQINPEEYSGYFGRGNVYYDMDEYDKAIQDYNKALELSPEQKLINNNLGLIWASKGDEKTARACFAEAFRAYPYYEPAYRNMALSYERSSDNDKAAEAWDFLNYIRTGPLRDSLMKKQEEFISALGLK